MGSHKGVGCIYGFKFYKLMFIAPQSLTICPRYYGFLKNTVFMAVVVPGLFHP
jgi:hypothetical protein